MKIQNYFWIMIHFAVMTTAFLPLMACAGFPFASEKEPAAYLSAGKNLPPGISQVLLVRDESFLFSTARKVYALEKAGFTWRQAMKPVDAVVGRNGFAPHGEKREGDGRTPSGLYRLGTAFGYAETAATRMPYRQALEDDLWIDDPNSPDYNRWVKQNQTRASSYEKMRRNDNLYKYGIVIEYNTQPVIRNHGSAIFLHIWPGSKSTTAGCVAVSAEDLLKILAWLNPADNPVILINPDPM